VNQSPRLLTRIKDNFLPAFTVAHHFLLADRKTSDSNLNKNQMIINILPLFVQLKFSIMAIFLLKNGFLSFFLYFLFEKKVKIASLKIRRKIFSSYSDETVTKK
jgi:hypothetical protein